MQALENNFIVNEIAFFSVSSFNFFFSLYPVGASFSVTKLLYVLVCVCEAGHSRVLILHVPNIHLLCSIFHL